MKTILFFALGFITLLAVTIAMGKIYNLNKYKIRTKAGIQKADYIAIGGIQQYIQIRGQDISSPVIMMLHGGPGSNMAYYSYGWQTALEKDYTIVHWDQRGCGNTYERNPKAVKPTVDLLLSDLDELVNYIRLAFHQEKVILMGHSWGTFLGGIYTGKHPEKVSAYVAISQMVDFKMSEQAAAQEAIQLANLAAKTQDAQKIADMLEAIMTYQKLDKPKALELMKFRQLKEKYLPTQYGNRMAFLQLFTPYMKLGDLKWMVSFGKLVETNSTLYEELFSNGKASMYDDHLQYQVPVIMVAGENDWTTPYCIAFRYFNEISAPQKEFIAIENTGHIPFVDQPKIFSEALLKAFSHVL